MPSVHRLAWLFVALVACSEAKSDDTGGGGAGASPTTGGAGGLEAGGASNGGSPSNGGSTSSSTGDGDLVINEISATGDWVELYNRGTAAFDLSGLGVADAARPGVPKLDEGITFPDGTGVAAGAYLFILAKQDAAAPGEQEPQTVCAPGPSPCFYAPFGLSDANGDEIFLLDGEDVLGSAEYPPAAATDPQTWCRVQDGDDTFAVCDPTPGAANVAH